MRYNTRFMDRLFSATEERDAELTEQVANDIEAAKENGSVDTDEVVYEDAGDGKVAITDKGNGEVTIAEQGEDGNYDLYPYEPTAQLEGYLHPGEDGVTPGMQQGAPDEDYMDHMQDGFVESPNAWETALEGPDGEGIELGAREFSVSTTNAAVLRIFSDQEFCERVFSEVIESEETAKVGDLKIEKDPEDENTVIVTSESTGDQAKVVMEDDEMEVTELDSKNFCGDGECCDEDDLCPLHVVGVDTGNHVLVDSLEYDEESAQDLAQRLTEDGVDAVQIFEDSEEARDYAINLLDNLGADGEDDLDEPEEVTYSDHTIYVTRYYSNNTVYMDRLFSEGENGISASQDEIESAIEDGEQIENDDEVITPVGAATAVVEDKETGEFTKIVIKGDVMDAKAISEDEADRLTDGLAVEKFDGEKDDEDEEDEEEEKEYSDIYSDEYETKFFSANEIMTSYMERIFSGDADEDEIESAIEDGEQVETDNEVITPIDDETAVIEDKDNGEFTKATLDEDGVDLRPISEDEASELLDEVGVEDEEEEKEYSDIYSDENETRFFSANEIVTDYMERVFNEETAADEDEIESAIEDGEQVETDDEVITPIDNETAIIEDKESGEYTKAVVDEDGIDLRPISEDDAEELLDSVEVEDEDDDEDEDEEEEKEYSEMDTLDKFFADVVAAPQGQMVPAQSVPAQAMPQVPVDELGNPVQFDANGNPIPAAGPVQDQPSLETIEDKAIAAVQSIQAAAAEAEATIMNAKAAPAQNVEPDLQEAQFSWFEDYSYNDDEEAYEKTFSCGEGEDTLVSFLNNI